MYVVLEQINYYPYQVKLINTLRGKNQQINVREEEEEKCTRCEVEILATKHATLLNGS